MITPLGSSHMQLGLSKQLSFPKETNFIGSLPTEIFFCMFNFCDFGTYIRLPLVCRSWNIMFQAHQKLKNLHIEKFFLDFISGISKLYLLREKSKLPFVNFKTINLYRNQNQTEEVSLKTIVRNVKQNLSVLFIKGEIRSPDARKFISFNTYINCSLMKCQTEKVAKIWREVIFRALIIYSISKKEFCLYHFCSNFYKFYLNKDANVNSRSLCFLSLLEVKILAQELLEHPLTSINLCSSYKVPLLPPDGLIEILESLKNLPSLTSLNLENIQLKDQEGKALAALLKSNRSIKKIYLTRYPVGLSPDLAIAFNERKKDLQVRMCQPTLCLSSVDSKQDANVYLKLVI